MSAAEPDAASAAARPAPDLEGLAARASALARLQRRRRRLAWGGRGLCTLIVLVGLGGASSQVYRAWGTAARRSAYLDAVRSRAGAEAMVAAELRQLGDRLEREAWPEFRVALARDWTAARPRLAPALVPTVTQLWPFFRQQLDERLVDGLRREIALIDPELRRRDGDAAAAVFAQAVLVGEDELRQQLAWALQEKLAEAAGELQLLQMLANQTFERDPAQAMSVPVAQQELGRAALDLLIFGLRPDLGRLPAPALQSASRTDTP